MADNKGSKAESKRDKDTRSTPDHMTMTTTGKAPAAQKGETTATQDPIPDAAQTDYSVTRQDDTAPTPASTSTQPPAPYHPGPGPNLIHQPQYEAQAGDPEANKKYQPGEPGYREPVAGKEEEEEEGGKSKKKSVTEDTRPQSKL